MSKSRASIFDDLEELDVSSFAPKPSIDKQAPAAEKVRAVSEAANFRSREAKPMPAPMAAAPPKRAPRRYRTGRNVQFNIKASQQTVDTLYAIADKQGWVLGQTLERAVAALSKELEKAG